MISKSPRRDATILMSFAVQDDSDAASPDDEIARAQRDLADLCNAAVGSSTESGVPLLMQLFAEKFAAHACVLWEHEPRSTRASEDGREGTAVEFGDDDQLFALASYMRCPLSGPALYNVPLFRSITGETIRHRGLWNCPDIRSARAAMGLGTTDFLSQIDCNVLLSARVRFHDGKHGALNLYRKDGEAPYSDGEAKRFWALSRALPDLHQAVHDKVSYRLISDVSSLLGRAVEQDARLQEVAGDAAGDALRELLDRVCRRIAEALHGLEVSIVLPGVQPGAFDVTGTNWPHPMAKRRYARDRGDGITGWVLDRDEPVMIFDLSHFQQHASWIERRYPGLTWDDPLGILKVVRQAAFPGEQAGALSYMACPIRTLGVVIGVLRCTAGRVGHSGLGPHYFAERDLQLLRVLATQVGQFWSSLDNANSLRRETRFWRKLSDAVGLLNAQVERAAERQDATVLTDERAAEQAFMASLLRNVRHAIRGRIVITVRLVREAPAGGSLYYAALAGLDMSQGQETRALHRLSEVRFDLAGTSFGARVMRSGKVTRADASSTDADEEFAAIEHVVEGARRQLPNVICSPVIRGNTAIGVLDLYHDVPGEPPPYVMQAARLIGLQLGLYQHYTATIRALVRVQLSLTEQIRERERLQSRQAQTFETLAHQLRTPVNIALSRFEAATRAGQVDASELLILRALCRRTARITTSLRLLADLSDKRPVRLDRQPLLYDRLVARLIEAAKDTELLVDPARAITVHVDRESFKPGVVARVRVDHGLFEQMLENLLDNAAKYSYVRTQIRITGGLTGGGNFHVTVWNYGVQIRANEVKLTTERFWRSDHAKDAADGSGIGLWFVDQIMKAHDGQLVVTPTTKENLTEIKLVFPVDREP